MDVGTPAAARQRNRVRVGVGGGCPTIDERTAEYADAWAAWLEDDPVCAWRDLDCQGNGAQPRAVPTEG